MTNEELVELIQAGDSEKLSDLWEQVERFVELKANRFIRSTPFSDDLAEDLKQAGFLAVVNAAAAFDLDRGFTFLSYLPYHLKVEFYKALGLRTERQRRDPLHTARSLETVLMESDNGDALTIEDTQGAPDPGYEDTEQRIYIDELRAALESEIDLLPEKEGRIIRRYYFEGDTLTAIAAEENVTPQLIRARKQKGMRLLRKRANSALAEFIEDRTPYYNTIGLNYFHKTHTSPVEFAVEQRLKAEQKARVPKTADYFCFSE